jgi:hypothetical protein
MPAVQADDIIDLLVEWEAQRQAGNRLSAEDLCPDDPGLQAELRNRMRWARRRSPPPRLRCRMSQAMKFWRFWVAAGWASSIKRGSSVSIVSSR